MIPLSVARMGLEGRAESLYLSGCIVVSSDLYNDLYNNSYSYLSLSLSLSLLRLCISCLISTSKL